MRITQAVGLVLIATIPGMAASEGTSEVGRLPQGSHYSGRPEAIQQQNPEYVLPQLVIGGEWTSTIKVANLSGKVMPLTTVFFVDNLGNSLSATFQTTTLLSNGTVVTGNRITDDGFTITLSPGAVLEVTFFGGSDTQIGHALFDFCSTTANCSSSGIYAEVILRNRNATRPDFESVFPLERPSDLQYMLWDNRSGLTNFLYLVNENTSTTSVSLDFMNAVNQIIRTVNVSIPGLGSQLLTMHVIAPEIIGRQGTLVIRATNSRGSVGLITATALRINPTNSFTPIRAFVPSH